MAELEWLELGFDGRALAHLVSQCGSFYEGHRAENDILALIYLLTHGLPDGETILAKLIACSEKPTYRVNAVDAPFDAKERLKSRDIGGTRLCASGGGRSRRPTRRPKRPGC